MADSPVSDDTVREWIPRGQIADKWDARIRGFQDGIPHMAWTVRTDGSIEYVNRRWKEFTGMSSEEMANWKWAEVIHPDDRQVFMDRWQSAMQSGEHFEGELRIRRHDGIYLWHSLKDWPAREEDGTIIRWFGTATDINEKRQLWEKLQASNKELTQFASMAAHDLLEPLRMVGSFISILQRKYADQLDERARGYMVQALAGSERMRLLIIELLEYSRVGHDVAPVQNVDAAEVLAETEKNLKSALEEADFVIEHGDLPKILINRGHLLSLFQNLISNGIKYHRIGIPSRIRVDGYQHDHAMEFSIRDNGIGVKEADRSRIFDAFTRLHTQDEVAGTGIGLAICKKIIDLNNGHIWMEGADTPGSIFKFSIPTNHT